ncbi:MAG: class I SAM-dependent methyltransferase [Desulfobacteraceae bacterium]|nr:class I SAM-dependent methyltransferase [Desulfobacteraceae bacterium]
MKKKNISIEEIAKRTAFIKAKNVLEFGGGDFSRICALALAFPDKVFYSIDFEYSKKAINNVIKYADLKNVNIIQADARNNIFRDNFFDFIFSIAVGEHIAELALFLEETYRVLKPGGEYYFRQAPFWTSVKGHHFSHWRPEVLEVLGSYQHLIFSAEEMRAYLRCRENLPFDIENCVRRIYLREDLSRLSERETKFIIERSKFIVDTWSTQYDDLYDEQKAQAVLKKCSKYTLNDLKIKGVVAVLRKPLEKEWTLTGGEGGLEAVKDPFLYRLGTMLVQAMASPGRNTIFLPYRLIRLCVMEFKKRKTMVTKDASVSNKYTEIRLDDVTLSACTATIKKQYIERFGMDKSHSGSYHETDWRRIEYISSLLPEAKSVLDIGIGNGAFLNLLMSLNRFQGILGIDIRRHSKFTTLFESRLYQIIYASVTNLPIANKCIDIVTCMELLEHLDRQSFLAALHELRRVSRFLIVTVPYNEPEPRPSYHKLRFTDSDLLTYFPRGEFILLKKSTGNPWMAIVERS